MLARLGWVASPVAVFLILSDRVWWRPDDPVASLGSVRLEQWLALAQLGLHGWLLWQAWRPEPIVPVGVGPLPSPAARDRR